MRRRPPLRAASDRTMRRQIQRVDSRFRGNDGNRRLQRVCSLDVPCAVAGRYAFVARFRGNDGSGRSARSNAPEVPCAAAGTDPLAMAGLRGIVGNRFPSFPRKRESTRAEVAAELPYKPATAAGRPAAAEGVSREYVCSSRLFPSFPRKRESTQNNESGDFPYKRESTGSIDHGCARTDLLEAPFRVHRGGACPGCRR